MRKALTDPDETRRRAAVVCVLHPDVAAARDWLIDRLVAAVRKGDEPACGRAAASLAGLAPASAPALCRALLAARDPGQLLRLARVLAQAGPRVPVREQARALAGLEVARARAGDEGARSAVTNDL